MAVASPSTALSEGALGEAIAGLGIHAPQPSGLEAAYAHLHTAVGKAFITAFKSVASAHGKHYVPTYLPEHQAESRVLQHGPIVLNWVIRLERLASETAEGLANARPLADALAARGWPPRAVGMIFLGQPLANARAFLKDAAGPFTRAFADYEKRALVDLNGILQGRPRPTPGAGPTWDSPYFAFWSACGYMLAGAFALQAVYSALCAHELYEVDGNSGVRAAAAKLGIVFQDAYGKETTSCDLLGISAMHESLEAYTTRLWAALGVTLRAVADTNVRPYAQLAVRLLDAELVDATLVSVPRPKPDGLRSWKSSGSVLEPAVPKHLVGSGSAVTAGFDPTWPLIVKQPKLYTVNVKQPEEYPANRPDHMHADAPAQLGLFVATTLYKRSAKYWKPVENEKENTFQPLPPLVNAGSLEFGGHHPPHKTHRSGAEMDLDTELRNLDNEKFFLSASVKGVDPLVEEWFTSSSKTHERWTRWLTAGIEASAADPRKPVDPQPPFDAFKFPPFDYYGTKPSDPVVASTRPANDKPEQVAQARAFCLSVLLSGTSRLLFGDPWVFIDCFRRLRVAWADMEKLLEEKRPRPYGWPTWKVARDVVMLEPLVHWNHWHAEWKHPSSDVEGWVEVWRGLGLLLDDMQSFLQELMRGLTPRVAQPVEELSKGLRTAWEGSTEDLSDLYELLYDGSSSGDRELLADTAHEGKG